MDMLGLKILTFQPFYELLKHKLQQQILSKQKV